MEITSGRNLYDIYVKSGVHVFFYVGEYSGGVYTQEATTTGDDKTKLTSRSETYISSYTYRRFYGW